jgi:putative ATPase
MDIDTLFQPDPDSEREPGGVPAVDDRPLAARMRPDTLAGFIGQTHLLGDGSALRTAIEQGHPHSMVLYGPPGTGKTTLARILAGHSQAAFEELSAVAAGRAEVRAVLERAAHRQAANGTPTVFFLDEIHRFNKAQQDALLPAVEDGLVTLIGATTENPSFEVNGALLSRMRVYALEALSTEEVSEVLRRAVAHGPPQVGEEAIAFLAVRSEGDARTALNALELASTTAAELGEEQISIARAEDALQRRAVLYDKGGDRHYDYISAWIKATRGSDPDASLYYLAVMLEGGEDPRFIVRRMVIFASEDIGNADPQALSVATAAAQAVEHVGLPEAKFALAQAAIYLSVAPKSNAAGRALAAAQQHVREHGAAAVPGWLRSGPRPGQEVGGYDYPHDHPGHVSPQELLPEGVEGAHFYEPEEAEAQLAQRLAQIRKARGR